MEGLALFWLALAVVVGFAASGRGRSGVGWFLIAILISPLLALILLLVMGSPGSPVASANMTRVEPSSHATREELARQLPVIPTYEGVLGTGISITDLTVYVSGKGGDVQGVVRNGPHTVEDAEIEVGLWALPRSGKIPLISSVQGDSELLLVSQAGAGLVERKYVNTGRLVTGTTRRFSKRFAQRPAYVQATAVVRSVLVNGQWTNAVPVRAEAASSQSKTCPRCAEDVKAAARVCRFCGHEFAIGAK